MKRDLFFTQFMKKPCNQTIDNNLDRDADSKNQLCGRRIKTNHLEIVKDDKITQNKTNGNNNK